MDGASELVAEAPHRSTSTETAVEIVVPVYNEAADLRRSIERLHAYLTHRFPLSWRITIADNASTDETWSIACELACELKGVRAIHIDRKGRGRALREVWSASTAQVVAYMDVDLSTDLDALLPLVAPLVSGHSDVAIGTRLAAGARVVRGPKREVISRVYNMLLKATMRSRFSDAQCGFKAVRADVARRLLPMIEDQEWFFDTELLLLAEHDGLRIHEVPVDWVDDTDSRVNVVGTATADLRGMWRMKRSFAAGRERHDDPRWVRPALIALLAGTALLYMWDLSASGWSNAFYSAAVQAGTKSWKAFFFGSSDAANFITVDKPPASLWVMEISARMFGVNSWSILVPQALEGVAAVGVLYATVRRWFSPGSGLIAGAVMATTPVAALMFRFDNPDALLVLLLTGAAYAMVRAHEGGRTRWLVLACALVGTGFLTKSLQAFVVMPAFALVYMLAGPPKFWRRFRQLAVAGVALIVASGWWVAVVELWPASSRPYIGGSQNNSVLNLVFGYNGFGRITGNETGSVGGGAAGTAGRWGPTGWSRLWQADWAGQVAWLIPAALILLVAGLVLTARKPRADRTRAAFLLWGGWLVVTTATFSFAAGIIHPYYAVALAPAIGALVGMGAATLWRTRATWFSRLFLAGALAVTSVVSYRLLLRSPQWHPSLRTFVLVVGLLAAAGIAFVPRVWKAAAVAFAAAGLVAALAGPAAYSLDTASTPHSGAIPSAGPTVAGGGFRGRGGLRGLNLPRGLTIPRGLGGAVPGSAAGNLPGLGAAGGAPPGLGRGLAPGGGGSGFLSATKPSAALVTALKANATSYTWVAATVNSNSAAGYQLASGQPVMAIGGFNGTDPWPTLAQFQKYVSEGKIHYYIASGFGGGRFGGAGPAGSASTTSQISAWVQSHFTATTMGGTTVYDLSR